ncbi:unnamed protein product [Periconia digitata]|uniref:Uncharacterized protein n=1 Tax=Periconia digitata TaxID=1303443 RepID=A0A9W4UE29_9PLEO|nr:unnamed protein product [Periconia digitata]
MIKARHNVKNQSWIAFESLKPCLFETWCCYSDATVPGAVRQGYIHAVIGLTDLLQMCYSTTPKIWARRDSGYVSKVLT